MAQNLLPTKGNLMALKRSRSLAQVGYELMDKKRNILIREMMSLIDDAAEIQSQIDEAFTRAYQDLTIANIQLGSCDTIAAGVSLDDSLDIQFRSVMGVELPHIPDNTPPPRLEYGFSDTNSALDSAYLQFHAVKVLIARLAQIEISIYRLAFAIKKTQKRANALSNVVIPGFDANIKNITDALEEKEREEFVRLKVIKNRI